jgi:hypothetical protein
MLLFGVKSCKRLRRSLVGVLEDLGRADLG